MAQFLSWSGSRKDHTSWIIILDTKLLLTWVRLLHLLVPVGELRRGAAGPHPLPLLRDVVEPEPVPDEAVSDAELLLLVGEQGLQEAHLVPGVDLKQSPALEAGAELLGVDLVSSHVIDVDKNAAEADGAGVSPHGGTVALPGQGQLSVPPLDVLDVWPSVSMMLRPRQKPSKGQCQK